MKRGVALVLALAWCGIAVAQESEKTTMTSETKTMTSECPDLLSNLWLFEDATPVPTGQLDLRLGYQWVTSGFPANLGDSDDDHIVTPALYWGFYENMELSVQVPVWLGDGGDAGGLRDGNYDTNVGVLWRLMNQEGYWPALALSGTARIPTGDGSSGVDGELRLVLTNEYDSGIRSHFNAWAKTVNGDNDESINSRRWNNNNWTNWWNWNGYRYDGFRDFQYGGIIGLDGPLGDDGSLRWVADYSWDSGKLNGSAGSNLLELGWEWAMAEMHKLGMSVQIGLDDEDSTPNFGAGLVYSFSIGS
ncbi:MAG: hypothetical protein J5J06_04615 [Phycisphaerae bacterium]|nr:hypothetical protein [Phycisphaerae bacterium]